MYRLPVVSLRLVRERTVPYATRKLENSDAVYDLLRGLLEDRDREVFWIICLNTKTAINAISEVSVGTVNSAPVHPREVFKLALMANATNIIAVHNHPSGDPTPSPEDRAITTQLKAAGDVLGIKLLDHVIIGDGAFYSFADQGSL